MSVLVLVCTVWSVSGKGWKRKEKMSHFSSESELVATERKFEGKVVQANLTQPCSWKSTPPSSRPQQNENAFRTPVFCSHLNTGGGAILTQVMGSCVFIAMDLKIASNLYFSVENGLQLSQLILEKTLIVEQLYHQLWILCFDSVWFWRGFFCLTFRTTPRMEFLGQPKWIGELLWMVCTSTFCTIRAYHIEGTAEQLCAFESCIWDGSSHGCPGAKCSRPGTLVSTSTDGSKRTKSIVGGWEKTFPCNSYWDEGWLASEVLPRSKIKSLKQTYLENKSHCSHLTGGKWKAEAFSVTQTSFFPVLLITLGLSSGSCFFHEIAISSESNDDPPGFVDNQVQALRQAVLALGDIPPPPLACQILSSLLISLSPTGVWNLSLTWTRFSYFPRARSATS